MLLTSLRDIIAKVNVIHKLTTINTKKNNEQQTEIDELNDYSTELLYELCLLKLGVEDSDI